MGGREDRRTYARKLFGSFNEFVHGICFKHCMDKYAINVNYYYYYDFTRIHVTNEETKA